MIGTRVTLRLRMSSRDAHLAGELVDGARILALFGDLATELLIRLDGDEGLFRAYESVEFLAPVLAGDYIEATAELVRVEATSRQMRFEARKVIANLRDPGLAPSAAEVITDGMVVCRATGTCVTPPSLQRRPRELYMPALPPGPAPGESPLVTPPVTDFAEVVLTAALAVDGVQTAAVVDEAVRCREAGAAVIHLHPRSAKDLVGEAIAGIRARTDCLVQTSLGGAPGMSLEERARPLSFHPELATLDGGTVNVGEDVVVNTRGRIRELAGRIKRSGCVAELQCYEVGHVEEALLLAKEGNVGRPLHVRFVLGGAGAMGASEENVTFLQSRLAADALWGVAGVGGQTMPLTELALRMGGHVRVGLDDVGRAAAYARSLGRTPVTPARARTILGVTPRNGA